ncbi:hypothetical protein [Phaeodactylibacter xiamenensis]|uniref:hypothetical protein n=1 Tax=Phaeodactylibacter xiamenensis TaxID=1524460 RepID=UPI003BAC0EE2
MNVKAKQRIAKEVIIVFFLILATLFFFGSISLYDWVIQNSINKTQKQIAESRFYIDSLKSLNLEIISKDSLSENPFAEQSRKKLYEQLLKDEHPSLLMSFDEFVVKYSSFDEVKNLYDSFYKEKLYSKSFIEFQNQFFSDISMESHGENIPNYTDGELENFKKEYSSALLKLDEETELLRKRESKSLSFNERIDTTVFAVIVMLIFVYPVRFAYYLISWAFRIVRQKQ